MTPDDLWLRGLAGQAPDEADPATALESRLLREALTTHVRPATALSDAQADQLLDAALRGAEPEPAPTLARAFSFCDGCLRRWQAVLTMGPGRWVPASGLAGALAVLALVVIINPLAVEPDETDILRSPGPAGLQAISDPQPGVRRDQLADDLAALGADVQRYERLGRFGIDAQFTLPLTADAAAGLKRLGLVPDAAGVVRIEVAQTGP